MFTNKKMSLNEHELEYNKVMIYSIMGNVLSILC